MDALNEVRWVLKITFVLDVLHHLETMKTFKKFTKKSTRIVVSRLMKFQKWQEWAGVHVSGFWPKICKWDVLPLNLFLACSKEHLPESVPGLEKSDWKWPKLFNQRHYRWWVGVTDMTPRLSKGLASGLPVPPNQKKSKTSVVKCENDDHCLFWCPWNCAPRVCTT